MQRQRAISGSAVLLVAIAVVAGTFSGVAAAETRSGGTVVEEGETVDGCRRSAGRSSSAGRSTGTSTGPPDRS